MSSKRTDEERAAALVALELCEKTDYPHFAAQELTGIPHSTLYRWEQEAESQTAPVAKLRTEIRAEFKEQVDWLRSRILSRAVQAIDSDEKISFRDLITGLKTTNEISQLLNSQPTSITEQRQSADAQRREIAEQAVSAIMAHKQLSRAAALQYLRERQPDLAAWAAAG